MASVPLHVCKANRRVKSHLKKLRAHSVATAFASRVLPVPGGPYSNTPENIEMSLLTCYLYRPGPRGNSTAFSTYPQYSTINGEQYLGLKGW